ncbi:APC family permease [Denitrificimonas caeni]|uniref:APC family permease n=1 Tax=Denitrificimonas caeni TaxID=521720 RepID=UPI00196306D5|nr:APC family permease [Denitrificimonas caeni]
MVTITNKSTNKLLHSAQSTEGFKKVLGIPALVLFGLAYMVPLAAFTTYGLVTQITAGHLPTAYLVTLLAMLFTAYSYGRMVYAHPYAGSVYSYTRKTFGSSLGFLAGWTLLLDYIFLPMLCYLLIGIYMSEYIPQVPTTVWILGSIALVTVLNMIGISSITRANWVLISAQLIFIAVFIVMAISKLNGQVTSAELVQPFYGEGFSFSSIMAGAAILCLSFLGFDAVSTLAEETDDPRRRLPLAIMLVTLIGGLSFTLVSYVGHIVFPQWGLFTNVDAAGLDVMRSVGGEWLVTFFTATYVAGCFAAAMVSQASVSRILFAMGRDGMLPKAFGTLKRRVPVFAISVVSIISLLAVIISLDLIVTLISFGALIAFSAVNLSVIKHYLIDERLTGTKHLLRYGLLPGIGFLCCIWLWTSLSSATFTLGLVWLAAGVVYLAVLTRMFTVKPPELKVAEAL